MGATETSLYQSTFTGVDVGRPRIGNPGTGSPGQIGLPPPGTNISPAPPSLVGAGPDNGAYISNLSESAAGYATSIRGQPVQIAYPYS